MNCYWGSKDLLTSLIHPFDLNQIKGKEVMEVGVGAGHIVRDRQRWMLASGKTLAYTFTQAADHEESAPATPHPSDALGSSLGTLQGGDWYHLPCTLGVRLAPRCAAQIPQVPRSGHAGCGDEKTQLCVWAPQRRQVAL